MSMSEQAAVHPLRRGGLGSLVFSGWEMRPSEAPLATLRTGSGLGWQRGRGALRAERCHKADPGMTTGSSGGIDEKKKT